MMVKLGNFLLKLSILLAGLVILLGLMLFSPSNPILLGYAAVIAAMLVGIGAALRWTLT